MKKWNQRFTFVANFVDVLAFIESSGPRSYEVEYDGHVFACRIDEAIDHSAVACLTTEVHAWRKAHGHRAGDAQPCARTQLRLVQDRVDECIGYYSIHLIDPTAVIGARAIEAARCEAAIRAFLAKQWAQFISLWVKHSKQSNGEAAAPRPRGGRPRDPNDDWAYEQVTLGRPRPEVYGEWLLRIGERADLLADPQDSFRRAITARRQERKKPEETE